MREIKDACPSCGAPIIKDRFGGYVCEYCGSRKTSVLKMDIDPLGFMTVEAFAKMPGYMLLSRHGEAEQLRYLENCASEQIKGSLAEGLSKFLVYNVDQDIVTGDMIVKGRISVKQKEVTCSNDFIGNDLHKIMQEFNKYRMW